MKRVLQCVSYVILVAFQIAALFSLNLLLKREENLYRTPEAQELKFFARELQYQSDHSPLALSNNKTSNILSSGDSRSKREFYLHNIKESNRLSKPRVLVIVAILSAPIRFDRREGIRRTWMQDCASPEILCRFFTDSLVDMSPNEKQVLVNESIRYGDIEFMPIPKGYNFGRRILWLLEWSSKHYHFHFFLRMDDDYFLCVKRLLFELPFRINKR